MVTKEISPVIFNYFNYTDKRTNFPDETSVSVSSFLYFDSYPCLWRNAMSFLKTTTNDKALVIQLIMEVTRYSLSRK